MTVTKQKWIVIDVKTKKVLVGPFGHKEFVDFDTTMENTRKVRCIFPTRKEAEDLLESYKNYYTNVIDFTTQEFDRIFNPNDTKYNQCTDKEKAEANKNVSERLRELMKKLRYAKESLEVKELTVKYTTK